MLEKLVIIGVGLIGGSFALDMKRTEQVRKIIGVGRSAANLALAVQHGIIDSFETHAAKAVQGADMVLLATPVGSMAEQLEQIKPALARNTIITDAGSTKRDVLGLFRHYLPDSLDRCVPAHPIAGSEQAGVAAARIGLYEGRRVLVTPLPETSSVALAQVCAAWQGCGANVMNMDAEYHDQIFAAVSHLPHLLSFAYINMLLDRPDAAEYFMHAGSGFRDFTRIAGGKPEMWRDVVLANQDILLKDLHEYRQHIDKLIQQLEQHDAKTLTSDFTRASRARLAWGNR